MSSLAQKDNTSEIEVSHISSHGFWINVRGRNHFMSYEDFPWFKNQPIEAIENVVEFSEGRFQWPDIDIDLTEASIEVPELVPLETEKQKKVAQR